MKLKLFDGSYIIIYGNYDKKELEEIRKVRNAQRQLQLDINEKNREEILKCKYCGGNGCTMCGW